MIRPGAPLADADVSRHKCMIYDGDPRELLAVVVPLLRTALRDGYRGLYLGSPDMVEIVGAALRDGGVDVPRELERQALILSSDRSHLVGGVFDPQRMVDSLSRLIDDTVAAGFQGLCATGDMRWELGDDANFDRLQEYEALLERVFRDKPLMGVCQYPRSTVPARAVKDAMLTHRSLYVGAELNRDNLFYVPPELLLQSRERIDGEVGQWMCDQITRLQRAERERDRALEEQRRMAQELERRVVERTVELEAANRELDAFSSSVSHDLRAPLRAIHGFGRMLSDDYAATLDAEGRRRLGLVIDGAARMGKLIDDLLRFSRASRAALRAGRCDMGALAREVLSELRAAGEVKADVRLGELPEAAGDPALVKQVLGNLLGNAIKYSSKKPEPRIEVGGEATTECVYWVKDNGAGFDMAYANKLFGIFQRLHSAGEFEGTGVGLALSKRIVERHGGRIWAEGAPGQGATFWFSLPRRG